MSDDWRKSIDGGLEEYLAELVSDADDGGYVTTAFRRPEFAWMEKRGVFDYCRKYLDGR